MFFHVKFRVCSSFCRLEEFQWHVGRFTSTIIRLMDFMAWLYKNGYRSVIFVIRLINTYLLLFIFTLIFAKRRISSITKASALYRYLCLIRLQQLWQWFQLASQTMKQELIPWRWYSLLSQLYVWIPSDSFLSLRNNTIQTYPTVHAAFLLNEGADNIRIVLSCMCS